MHYSLNSTFLISDFKNRDKNLDILTKNAEKTPLVYYDLSQPSSTKKPSFLRTWLVFQPRTKFLNFVVENLVETWLNMVYMVGGTRCWRSPIEVCSVL